MGERAATNHSTSNQADKRRVGNELQVAVAPTLPASSTPNHDLASNTPTHKTQLQSMHEGDDLLIERRNNKATEKERRKRNWQFAKPRTEPRKGFDQTQMFELARSTKQRRARHRPATTKQWCAPSANSQRRQPTRPASDMLVQHNNNNTQQQGHKNKNTPPHRTGEDTWR